MSKNGSLSEKFLDCIKNRTGNLAYFDIDLDFLMSVIKKKDIDPVKDIFEFCNLISNPFTIGFGDITRYVPQLNTKRQTLDQQGDTITYKIYFDTPLGQKGWVLKRIKGSLTEKISEATSTPVSTKEDFQLFDWFYDEVSRADWTACIADIRKKIAEFQGQALASIFLVPPFELLYWTRREEMYYLNFDYPDEYNRAMEQIIKAYDVILNVARQAGISLVAYGAPGGTEFTSPKIWADSIVPSSAKLQKIINSNGLYSIFHCCGKIKTIISNGFFNDINPDILETLSPPPVGDIADIGQARSLLNKNIMTHGNIDLTFLRDCSVDEAKQSAIDINKQTADFPQFIGAADGCLLPNTPPENIKVICELFNCK